MSITVKPADFPPEIPVVAYFAFASGRALGDSLLDVGPEDIIAFDGTDFSPHFDGSDVGPEGFWVDAFSIVNDIEILLSFGQARSIPGIADIVDDSDIVKFTAASLGEATSGSFELYFDGSDVGLNKIGEDIDAIELLDNGHILLSTTGSFRIQGVTGKDEDIIEFTPESLGHDTAGSWALYFDGSDVGLGARQEDVDAMAMDAEGRIYLSTSGDLSVAGVQGADEDILVFNPASLGSGTRGAFEPALIFDGSDYGLSSSDVLAFELGSGAW